MLLRFSSCIHSSRTESYTLSLHDALPISELERRRIASDLHDGVVQQLAGTSFSLEAAAERQGPNTDSGEPDRKSTRLNSSHVEISYAVFCLKKKKLYTV